MSNDGACGVFAVAFFFVCLFVSSLFYVFVILPLCDADSA